MELKIIMLSEISQTKKGNWLGVEISGRGDSERREVGGVIMTEVLYKCAKIE
jgi:hypothetical protein